MEQMLMEFERKKLLIQDDTEGLLVLANKMQSLLENKEENLNNLNEKLKKYPEFQSVTLTIIKSRDHPNVFGIFAYLSWENSTKGHEKSDPHAFIFSLVNEEHKADVFRSTNPKIYSMSIYGPTFCSDHANLRICSNANSELGSCFSFKSYYGSESARLRTMEAGTYLAGSKDFFVAEIEVFKIAF